MDGDGDQDILISDWYANNRMEWYENPGTKGSQVTDHWKQHIIGICFFLTCGALTSVIMPGFFIQWSAYYLWLSFMVVFEIVGILVEITKNARESRKNV